MTVAHPAGRWRFVAAACSLVCLLNLTACAAPGSRHQAPDGGVELVGLLVDNASTAFASSVRLLIPATGRFTQCAQVAPGSRCTVAFQGWRWGGDPVVASWRIGDLEGSTGEVDLQAGQAVRASGRAWIRVVVGGPDVAAVSLVPGN